MRFYGVAARRRGCVQMPVGRLAPALNMEASGVFLDGVLLSSNNRSSRTPKKEAAMTSPQDDKNEMRMMWIGSAAILFLILAAMGINMLIAHDTNGGSSTETTGSLSGAAPPK
jgi:hypothetical protein